MDLHALYDTIYVTGDLLHIDEPLPYNPILQPRPGARANSLAIVGGAFGDEGKGRIVDALCNWFAARSRYSIIVYRWNGGANAGHTVVVGDKKISLHQLPSGAMHERTVTMLGKGMVLHPADLVEEIERVRRLMGEVRFVIQIDGMAVLSLDTHRAFEAALRDWATGGKGATGRGIAPAYADVLLRHAVRVRDYSAESWRESLGAHYDLYAALLRGLGQDMATMRVPALGADPVEVGSRDVFLDRLAASREALRDYFSVDGLDAPGWWGNPHNPVIFEGAQGIGIDGRYGVYPDITASDPTFSGITASTEGAVRVDQIAMRAGALKATYTSSVGARRLPTQMDEASAHRIREDANEYGATTRRPRDIAHIDIPCLSYLAQVSGMTHVILTHLDIAYPDMPIQVCTHYTDARGRTVGYRPDQRYLDTVTPHYMALPGWDGRAIQGVKTLGELPRAALQYIAFLTNALGVKPVMATTGPEREAIVSWLV